jgi:DNA-binding NarL/FixJ family response regulator
MTIIRIVLADDHPVVLAGVRTLLEATPDMNVVGEATTGRDALKIIGETLPDVAVIDISMPDVNGIELARDVVRSFGRVRLLVLTVHEDRAYVQRMLQAGTRGYLLKRTAAEELIRAIRAIHAGGVYLDPAIADKALPDAAAEGTARGEHTSLSPREEGVLRLTAQGFNNKEIARTLEVGIKSVETYKARALEKLNLRTRAEIVRYGLEQGWLDGIGAS